MGFYGKAYKGTSSGAWVKASGRGVAVGQRLGGNGPFAFGVATGTRRPRRGNAGSVPTWAVMLCVALALLCIFVPALFVVLILLAPVIAVGYGAVSGFREGLRESKYRRR